MLDTPCSSYRWVSSVVLTVVLDQKTVENHVAWVVTLLLNASPAWPADSHGIIGSEFTVFWGINGRNPNFVTQSLKQHVLV